MTLRTLKFAAVLGVALLAAGCTKGGADFSKARKAESRDDFDTALIHYDKAERADPNNARYQIGARRARFEAAQMHVDTGNDLLEQGLLQPALAEFRKAVAIDPSSFIAEQQADRTLTLIAEERAADDAAAATPQPPALRRLSSAPTAPPRLKTLSDKPLNLKMNEDSKAVFQAIGALGDINVIFDPDFQSRRIPVDLKGTTVEEALDVVALMTKTFWKVVTPNTILVAPDQTAKRKTYEEQIIKTFYLENISEPTELNELVQTLRQLLDIVRITPSTIHNAIIIRDTPDKVAIAEKIIHDIDRARPEVVIQVAVLQARRDRARDLGILPSTAVPLLFTPRATAGGEGGTGIPLNDVDSISSADYSLILPSATAMALLTDSTTRIIQNPQIRTTDGETAKLNIGDKVPFASGSFQGGGVGGIGINPLVNTQFQFQDVGVNLDVTPHVHSNREITLDILIEVSSVTGRVNIGGIEQPIFGQRKIEHKIRLKEGEVSILGGIIEVSEDESMEGWPGFAQIPFLKYFFSNRNKTNRENEVLIVLTPRLIRLPEISDLSRRPLSVGTDANLSLPRAARQRSDAVPTEVRSTTTGPEIPGPASPSTSGETPTESPSAPSPLPATGLMFSPPAINVAPGEQVTMEVMVRGAEDLFSVAFSLGYDPAVVKLINVGHGGFLGGAERPPALIHRIQEGAGRALVSLGRAPDSAGVNGEGALVRLVFEGVSTGQSILEFRQVRARNSSQQPISLPAISGRLTVE